MKLRHHLSIGRTKAHTGLHSPGALGNATADRLSACAREDGLNINGGPGVSPSLSSTCPFTASSASVRKYAAARFPQAPTSPPSGIPGVLPLSPMSFYPPHSGRCSPVVLVSVVAFSLSPSSSPPIGSADIHSELSTRPRDLPFGSWGVV